MAVRVIRENNRSEGRLPATGEVIIAGQPLTFASATTVRKYNAADATAVNLAYGIAAESTAQLPLASPSGLTAGEGYDYTNFARGGLVSCFITGSELELFDDGHGLPYDNTATYVLNAAVYAKLGLVTSVAASASPAIGSVVDFDAATGTKRLRIKFSI